MRIILGLLITCFCGAAQAQPQRTYSQGPWSVLRTVSDRGNAMCTLLYVFPSRDRYMSLKFTPARPNDVMFQLARPSWNIPQGTSAGITFTFDNGRPWIGMWDQFDAVGMAVDLSVNEWTNTFARLFSTSSRIRFSFAQGNEQEWSASLAGSTRALDAFHACARAYGVNIEAR